MTKFQQTFSGYFVSSAHFKTWSILIHLPKWLHMTSFNTSLTFQVALRLLSMQLIRKHMLLKILYAEKSCLIPYYNKLMR